MVESSVQHWSLSPQNPFRLIPALSLLSAAAAASLTLAQAQNPMDESMPPPFGSGMPDIPGEMPDMPGVSEMPNLGEVPEMGGLPEFGDMTTPTQIEEIKPKTSSLEQKRQVLRTELDKLSTAEQRQLRLALRRVWANRKVVEAREAYREAGQRYQRALHSAMLEQDEQVRPFLERLIKAGLHIPLGKAAEPYVQVAGLFEVSEHLLEPHKEEIRQALSHASQTVSVLTLRLRLQQAPASDFNLREDLNHELRDALRSSLLDLLPSLKEWITETSELSA